MKIYVIRHGETEQGKNRIIANISEPLNKNGVNQATNVGKKLRELDLDVIYCSPIERARHTLELFDLDKSIPVEIEDRLKERNMGIYENISFDNLDWDMFWNYNSDKKYAKLESMKDVYLRIKEFLDELKKKYKDENNLLVTHVGISRAIYWFFNGIPKNGNSSDVNENCKIYEYEL